MVLCKARTEGHPDDVANASASASPQPTTILESNFTLHYVKIPSFNRCIRMLIIAKLSLWRALTQVRLNPLHHLNVLTQNRISAHDVRV